VVLYIQIKGANKTQEEIEMSNFEKALINAEIEKQNKTKVKAAKKAYIADLVKMGIDKTIAKAMADANFEYGIVTAM
jgi:hypothetical protein